MAFFNNNNNETTKKPSYFANKFATPEKLVTTEQTSLIGKMVEVRYSAGQINRRVKFTGMETFENIIKSVIPSITDEYQVSTSGDITNATYKSIKNTRVPVGTLYISITQGKADSGA